MDLQVFFLGGERVEFDDFAQQLGDRRHPAAQGHHAGFRFGDVHECMENDQDPVGFFHAIGQGLTGVGDGHRFGGEGVLR